jgi:hypothetical protein
LHLLQIAPRRFKNRIDDQGRVTSRVGQQAGAGRGLFFEELKTAEAWIAQDASRPQRSGIAQEVEELYE